MIVLVPSTIALLPAYGGIEDPVAELRAACLSAVQELVADGPSEVAYACAPTTPENVARGVTEPAGLRIARYLLAEVGWSGHLVEGTAEHPLLVVGNGSARRTEKAPGHLDERAVGFDDALGRALVDGDGSYLAGLDASSAEELWCHDVAAFHALAKALPSGATGQVSYADDPYGVQYWVVTWR